MKVTRFNLKITALLCALAVFVTSVSFVFPFISASADAPSGNLVKDGGFDTELDGTNWTDWSRGNNEIVAASAQVAGDTGKTGDRALKANANKNSAYQFVNFTGGYYYTISFLLAPGGTSSAESSVTAIVAKSGTNYLNETYKSNEYGYREVSYTFKMESDVSALLYFAVGACTAYIDDIKITASGKVEEGQKKEIIKNGGFDTDDNWQLLWDTSIVSSPAAYGREGNKVLNMKNYAGGALQTIQLEKGVTYNLSFKWAPGASGGSSSSVNVRVFTGSDGNVQSNWVYNNTFTSQNYAYTDCSASFTATETTAAKIWLRNPVSISSTYIDDVSIVETTPAGGDFFRNGDFEDTIEDSKDLDTFSNEDNYGWLLQDESEVVTDKVISGDKSVLVKNDLWGRFAVDSKTTVGLYGKYFGLDGAKAKITISADRDGYAPLFEAELNGNGEWQDIEERFETDFTTIIYVHIESVSGENYFDALKLLKLVAVTLSATPGAAVELDRDYTVPGDTVTLTIKQINTGYSIAEGYPRYTALGVTNPLTKVSDTEYTFVMPESNTTVEISFTVPVGAELLPDYGFESGEVTGWATMDGQVTIDENNSYDGEYSAAAVKYAYYALKADVYIEQGSTYLLSFLHNGANIGAGVFLYDGWENNYIDPILTGDDDDWNRYSAVFIANKSGTMTVLVKNEKSPDTAYFDNISLKKVDPNNPDPDAWVGNYNPSRDPIADTSNIIKDSGFEERKLYEDKNLGWTPWAESYKTSLSFARQDWLVNSGESSMRVAANTPTAATQIVKVKPFTSYELTFYAVSDTNGAGISIGSAPGTPADIYSYRGVKAAEGYVKYTTVFKTNGVTEVHFSLSNETSGAVHFDDVTLCELDDSIKGDLGFRKTASITTAVTDNSITLKWSSVKSKLYHNEDLTYRIYYSKNKITKENIASLNPVSTSNGKQQRRYVIENLKDYTDYYLAVEAEDKSGNKAYLFSDAIKTNIKPGTQVMNGGFERGDLLYWYSLSPASWRVYETGSSGKYSLEMKDWCYLVYQPVVVEPDTEYVFSYDATQATGNIKAYVLDKGSLSFSDALYEKQIDESFDYKKYSGTIKTGADTNRVNIAFYNGSDYNYAYIDNVYFKKIENKDLYFFSEPQSYFVTQDSITVNWLPVHSADDAENITYEVFISEKEITAENIGSLTPFRTLEGADKVYASAMELDTDKGYYFAIRAKDSLGNTAVEFSSSPFFTIAEEAEEEEEDEEDDEEIIEEDITDGADSDNFVDLIIDSEVTNKEEENLEENSSNKKISEKILTSTTVTPLWGRRIAGIILIVLGCVFAVTPILLIIKKKRKKGV